MPGRGRGHVLWLAVVLGGVLAAGALAGWGPAGATPPVTVSVWLDRVGVEAAAAGFDPEARRAFGRLLAGLAGAGRCDGQPPGPPFACVDESALLTRALPVLACAAVHAKQTDRVEAFFETLARRRLVRGVVSFVGATTVTYRLVRPAGGWAISEAHRAISPRPGADGREVVAFLECRDQRPAAPEGSG
jgi:hypothetical protein